MATEISSSGGITAFVISSVNKSMVCQSNLHIQHSIWQGENPLGSMTSLLLLQLSIISVLSSIIHLALQPLGQISVASQILTGLILGASCLGRFESIRHSIFPPWGITAIETFTTFGIMFFVFGLGVKMNPRSMMKPGRKAGILGILALIPTFTISIIVSVMIGRFYPMDIKLRNSMGYIAGAHSLTGFPVVSYLLNELRIHNTDIARLAMSSAMFCDTLNILISTFATSLGDNPSIRTQSVIMGVSSSLALLLMLIFLVRPLIQWLIHKTPHGKPMAEVHFMSVIVIVFISGLISEFIGQHYILGPLFLGLMVPDGPPLGTAIELKAEALVSGLLYPAFISLNGMQSDIFIVSTKSLWIIGLVVFTAILVKFLTVLLGSFYLEIPGKEAVVLALILNTKGVMELAFFNMWKNAGVLTDEVFTVCVISVLMVTAITTPFIKYLYDPDKQYISTKRCTIQHSKHDAELRILICLHKQENVLSLLNLVEISHASGKNPILVFVMVLMELVGRTTPILVSHKDLPLNSSMSFSTQIANAFKNYGLEHEGSVTVETFTAICDFLTMHDDICQVALDEAAHLVVVPYHKLWSVDGNFESANSLIRTMNINVLEKAPCSVGILIDRGPIGNSLTVLNSQSFYRVGVLFIGGPDDGESLAYGCRMLKHQNVVLTVIRFLLLGSENTKDRKHDSELIYQYRHENMGNERFEYIEEVVRDGVGLAAFLKGIACQFDLIIVGRQQPDSPIFLGLDQWSECPEIGLISDMLASPDFESSASVLVIQQQRLGGNYENRLSYARTSVASMSKPMSEPPRGSWAISMDKYSLNPKEFR